MIYDDHHLYVALPKCGSSFVQVYLQQKHGWKSTPHEPFGSWHHRPLCLAPPDIREGRRLFAVMRNPWAWYRSLYYAEPHKHAAWETGKHHDFQSWLRLILDGKGHPFLPMHHRLDVQLFILMGRWGIGLLTCNYIIICGNDPGAFVRRQMPPEKVSIGVNNFLRTESLSSDLAAFLGHDVEKLKAEPRVNVSTTGHYSQDYTPELAELVAQRDKLILERFGYEF